MVAGRWRILAQIAEGGMGTVYRAEHVRSHRTVALKALKETASEEARQRMLREARLAARIEHPNVVSIFDVDVVDQVVFLVMELLRGETLDDWMEARAGASREDPAPFLGRFLPALAGLAELHRQGILHRDFKPENIFLADYPDGQTITKLLDLGIARDQHATSLKLTSPESLIGTPAYMAPEQVEGDEASLALDVFAAGVVLYEGLAGSRPFPATNVFSLVHEIVEKDPVPLQERCPELPPELCAVVMRCLEKAPSARYEDARALLDALREHAPRGAISAPPAAISTPPGARSKLPGGAPGSDARTASGPRKVSRASASETSAPETSAAETSASETSASETPASETSSSAPLGIEARDEAPAHGDRWVYGLVALGMLFLGVAGWSASAWERTPEPAAGPGDETRVADPPASEPAASPPVDQPVPAPASEPAAASPVDAPAAVEAPAEPSALPDGLEPPTNASAHSSAEASEVGPSTAREERAAPAGRASARFPVRRTRPRAEEPSEPEPASAPEPSEPAPASVPEPPEPEPAPPGRRIQLDVSQF
ncbi:MAG: hypothetical protein CMH59_09515 [Myxococcales bacterium]|nr:hypothetical protein [Myxococcales bacterium]